jgi:hypothetical protein
MRNPSYIKVLSINNTRKPNAFEGLFEQTAHSVFRIQIKEECRLI